MAWNGTLACVVATGLLGAGFVAAQAPGAPGALTGRMIEYSNETRFQLDLKVPDRPLAAYLPTGWTPNVATQGAAKDCNLRAIFIDRVTVNGPDGRPAGTGSSRVIWLAAPVKDPGGANVQLIIGGLTDEPADAPGPFGNYLLAASHALQRTTTNAATGTGPTIDTQDWNFTAASGEHLELHLKYEKGVGNKGNPNETRYYSAKNPTFFQISRQEQVLDILRNTTTNPPDRVKEFTFKGSGGSWAKLFDGTEKSLSWDNILWINRTVSLP
jgi:hypothetical protein